ncbi:unnamed protein product [Calicophoron daubneyi]|uniref:GLTSCR protein conserved domain-containing protein n=1 Tax=Calicophoron daubneyi TaxID=300641 RepID=A0AAV2TRT4_CALDB
MPVAVTSAPGTVPSAVFASALLSPQQPQQQQQQQQPVMISGGPGGFFLAQPATVGGTPVMLAPGQPNTSGTFVVAQPIPQTPNNGTQVAQPAPAGCIIRLPDGRLVMSASGPSAMGLHPSNLAHFPGGQPAYFPIAMHSGSVPSTTTPSLSLQQPSGVLTPGPGQAFYIQMPSNATGGFGGTVFTPTSSTTAYQSPANSHLKTAPQSMPCVASPPLTTRQPVLIPAPPCGSQSLSAAKTSGFTNAAGGATHNQITPFIIPSSSVCIAQSVETQSVQSQPKPCSLAGNVTQLNCVQSISTALPGGMAITRLPNGTFTAVPYNHLQNSSSPLVGGSTPPVTSSGAGGVKKGGGGTNSRSTPRQIASSPSMAATTADVLKRLDEQIAVLQSASGLTEAQSTRLKQLVEVRLQLSKATASGNRGASSPLAITANRRSAKPVSVQISPTLRRELLDMLARNSLLPRVNAAQSETFVVEFRLNQQRYQLRLTRQQKVDMERLLFSVDSQRQAEILTVLQQEQSRPSVPRNRLPTPVVTPQSAVTSTAPVNPAPSNCGLSVSAQPVRLQPQIQPFVSAPSIPLPQAFGNPAGLRLVAARPMLPTAALPNTVIRSGSITMGTSTPVMGVVTALAMPPVAAQGSTAPLLTQNLCPTIPSGALTHGVPSISGSSPATGLFLSSLASPISGTQTFVMQQPVMAPSSVSSSVIPVSSGVSQLHQTTVASYPQPPSFPYVLQPVHANLRPSAFSIQQATRLGRMRSMLASDMKRSVERIPAECDRSDTGHRLLTPLELLEALAPYHILRDGDNTDEALLKVDQILDDSLAVLLRKKHEAIQAVNALLFKETMKMETHLEEKVILANMALSLERDVFTAEKTEYAEIIQLVPDMPCEKTANANVNNKKHSNSQNESNSNHQFDDSSASDKMIISRVQQKPSTVNYLKYPSSLLPSPWPNLFGPLANLRPLTFDTDGNAKWASLNLPEKSDPDINNTPSNNAQSIDSATPTDKDVMASDSSIKLDTSDRQAVTGNGSEDLFVPSETSMHDRCDDRDEDDIDGDASTPCSSDDAEADLLLGLGTHQSRSQTGDLHSNSNGLLDDDVRDNSGLIGSRRHRSSCMAFDETYDLWQELMREEGMDVDEMGQDTLDSCLDSESNCLPSDEPPNKSLRLLDTGPAGLIPEVQHSEDPDIDAAIRSILSSSD